MNERMIELIRAAFGATVTPSDGYIHVYEWPECICDEDDFGNAILNSACQAHTGQPVVVFENILSRSVSERVSSADDPSVSHE